jgi:hypothetical protein
MFPTSHQEVFSRAYINAIISGAGFGITSMYPDLYGTDIGVASDIEGNKCSSPRLEIQAKSTIKDDDPESEIFSFQIKRKYYDELRKKHLVPKILVVVTVPENVEEWLNQTEKSLTLYKCAYWKLIEGQPERNDITIETKLEIPIERSQRFTVDALQGIMRGIAGGTFP